MSVRVFHIRDYELNALQHLMIMHRLDWPAVFSTNAKGDVWPQVTWGRTPEDDRIEVGHAFKLDAIGMEMVRYRPGGGRFFIDERGAFLDDRGQKKIFVRFKVTPS